MKIHMHFLIDAGSDPVQKKEETYFSNIIANI